MKEFTISDREAGQRFDKYLFRLLDEAGTGFVYRMLRKKNIVLNGKKAVGSEILVAGDKVRLYLSEDTFRKFAPGYFKERTQVSSEIDIVYEDENIIVIDKPAGLLSQKSGPEDDSANDRIIAYLIASGQMSEDDLRTFHPSICSRLDRNTSGLLVAGKTMEGLQKVSRALRERTAKKYYLALAAGHVESSVRLKGYLKKNESTNKVSITDDGPGEVIETAYRPVEYHGDTTLLEIQLITGKSHQIRAHLASVGHPVLGDPKYGDREINRRLYKATGIRHQLLHAWKIKFPDGMTVEAPAPETFIMAEKYLDD